MQSSLSRTWPSARAETLFGTGVLSSYAVSVKPCHGVITHRSVRLTYAVSVITDVAITEQDMAVEEFAEADKLD